MRARCCVKVATRRLLIEQLVVVAILGSGKKSDAMWHVLFHSPFLSFLSEEVDVPVHMNMKRSGFLLIRLYRVR